MFDRQHRTLFRSWWWTVDRPTLYAIIGLISIGTLLVATGSTAVAERVGLESFYFLKRHLIFLVLSLLVLFTTSLLPTRTARTLSLIGFIAGLGLMVAVLLLGDDVKGAKRWVTILGFSLQPSEFVKPLFAVTIAWILARGHTMRSLPVYKLSCACYALFLILLLLQPDLGMTILVSATLAAMFFLSGLSWRWVGTLASLAILGMGAAYAAFPHVAHRIDTFLGEANYQVQKSLDAFESGGLLGRGPGEGVVKQYLPDSHADFIFAIAGEELGIIACIIIVALYALIVYRGIRIAFEQQDPFITYATCGLLIQFALQAIINMGVSLHMLPTKGMTLPFMSYGGSSMMATALALGLVLSFTRKRYGRMIYHRKIPVTLTLNPAP